MTRPTLYRAPSPPPGEAPRRLGDRPHVWQPIAGTVGWFVGPWRKCRAGAGPGRNACGADTVAWVLRGLSRWGYCREHLAEYGLVLHDGALWRSWPADAR